jgi:hypothetical protein
MTKTMEEKQSDFWENMGDVFGTDIIGSDHHPLKEAFKSYCEMMYEDEDDEEEEAVNNSAPSEKICPKCNKEDCGAGAGGGLCVSSTSVEIKEWEEDEEDACKTNKIIQLTKEFTFIKNIDDCDLKDDYAVKKFVHMLEKKHLKKWIIGKRGDYISSYFITSEGSEDYLTSPRVDDINYSYLILAHLYRALTLLKDGC